ncbi:hypothetical protein E1B28_008126 [Marasmius oreades]|uniref:Uncharacterized protein n=1 Tax=Marasmius oreades TaxID=181124 RepID=A0A9P7RXV6_9AGAR|nr:uncharacterized protein E1B28_008126 [Marasmius oreades]KAG7091725.1 hypothetical protein E1B28_008126 [Marasmius oreades]
MISLSETSETDAVKALRFKAIHRDMEGIDAIARRTVEFLPVYMLEKFGATHLKEFAIG